MLPQNHKTSENGHPIGEKAKKRIKGSDQMNR
jgi:hypothetical protein